MARRNKRGNANNLAKTINQQVSEHAAHLQAARVIPEPKPMEHLSAIEKADIANRMTLQMIERRNEAASNPNRFKPMPVPRNGKTLDEGTGISGSNGYIPRSISVGRKNGRPRNGAQQRETMPVPENKARYADKTKAGWEGLPSIIQRDEIPLFSFENLKWSDRDLRLAMRKMGQISADIAYSRHLIRRLVNTGLVISVKEYDDEKQAEPTREDPVATRIAIEFVEKAGQEVVCDFPGAMGGISDFIDQLAENAAVDGAMFAENVLNASRDDVANWVTIDPLTAEFRRDPNNPGSVRIGQKRYDVPGGWQWLNPLLVTYSRMNPDGIYAAPEQLTALHYVPLYMGYFGKLQIFLQRAAFGFLDGAVKQETLELMWKNVAPKIKAMYDNNFMEWSQEMIEFIGESYKESEQNEPDSMQVHSDLLTVSPMNSGNMQFPIPEASKLMKKEVHLSAKTPGELMGEETVVGDRFVAMKIEAYHAYLKFIQGKIIEIINRFINIGLQVRGYTKRVKADCRFNPIPIDDRLTQAQALQLEQLCQRFLRDENIISQNEMSRNLVGKPAIGQAPMALETDPDGASGPDPMYLAVRKESGGDTNLEGADPQPGTNNKTGDKAAAGGTSKGGGGSYGGAKKGRDSNVNQQKDKKMEQDDQEFDERWAAMSIDDKKSFLLGRLLDLYPQK